MDEFMKMIMQAAINSQKQMNRQGSTSSSFGSINNDAMVRAAKESAKMSKILFDEYVKVGFSQEQAFQIVTSILSKNN